MSLFKRHSSSAAPADANYAAVAQKSFLRKKTFFPAKLTMIALFGLQVAISILPTFYLQGCKQLKEQTLDWESVVMSSEGRITRGGIDFMLVIDGMGLSPAVKLAYAPAGTPTGNSEWKTTERLWENETVSGELTNGASFNFEVVSFTYAMSGGKVSVSVAGNLLVSPADGESVSKTVAGPS